MTFKMEQNNTIVTNLERRRKPRIDCHYTATVHGRDAHGNKFEESATLANLSSTGLFMWLNRPIELGEKIFVTVRLTSELIKEATPRIATDGIVIRTEPQPDGLLGVAIVFQHYRFL